MTKETLVQLIDALFSFAEDRMGAHPLLKLLAEQAKRIIEGAGLDALLAFLQSKGIA